MFTALYFFFFQPQIAQTQPQGGGATQRNRDRMKRRWAQIEAEDQFILEAIAKAFNE